MTVELANLKFLIMPGSESYAAAFPLTIAHRASANCVTRLEPTPGLGQRDCWTLRTSRLFVSRLSPPFLARFSKEKMKRVWSDHKRLQIRHLQLANLATTSLLNTLKLIVQLTRVQNRVPCGNMKEAQPESWDWRAAGGLPRQAPLVAKTADLSLVLFFHRCRAFFLNDLTQVARPLGPLVYLRLSLLV